MKKTHYSTGFGIMMLALIGLSCGDSGTGPQDGGLDLYLMPDQQGIPVIGDSSNVDDLMNSYFGSHITQVTAKITGAGMAIMEVALSLEAEEGVLAASIEDISSGSQRSVRVELRDDADVLFYAGERNVNITGGKQAELSVVIAPESEGPPVLALPDSMKVDLEFVLVEGGTFMMGSEGNHIDETPVHQVTLSDYYISKTEVTNAMYVRFLNDFGVESDGTYRGREYIMLEDMYSGRVNPIVYERDHWTVPETLEDYPVAFLYPSGVSAFCSWLGVTYPTEAQWEYAARGGRLTQNYLYAGSDEADEVAWYNDNSGGETHSVAQKSPNELGLYDMSGNVWEICRDGYRDYSDEEVTDPLIRGGSTLLRGGCMAEEALHLRSANRDFLAGGTTSYVIGFRCAVSTY